MFAHYCMCIAYPVLKVSGIRTWLGADEHPTDDEGQKFLQLCASFVAVCSSSYARVFTQTATQLASNKSTVHPWLARIGSVVCTERVGKCLQ